MEDLYENPNLAPCAIEIFGETDREAMIAKAERYLEILRLSIPEMGRPESLDLDLRLGSQLDRVLTADIATTLEASEAAA